MTNRNLSPQQFVSHTELAQMYSGDHDVRMKHALPEMVAAEEEGFDHPRAAAHGGSAAYVDHLAVSIAQHGVTTPIEVRGGNVITDGHHRALAAIKLRLSKIPVEHYQ